MSHAIYLMNRMSEARYLCNSQLLFTSNLFEFYDSSSLDLERDRFIELTKSIDIPRF